MFGGSEWNLRDAATSTWSSPVKSQKLSNLHKKKTDVAKRRPPKIHSQDSIIQNAAAHDEEKRLTTICQKPANERTDEEVRFTHMFMRQLSPFFSLWPDNLQRELARVLVTEGRVRNESVISRGVPLGKVFFLINGKLRVSVPVPVAARPADQTTSSTGQVSISGAAVQQQQEELRVLAHLKRGDACGEAALLGQTVAHADVIVDSSGAVMLSLSYTEFLRAFKEILGLRQQDRLTYLRMHPLLVDVPLQDLDAASDLLHLAFYTPGTCMYPRKKGDGRVFFLAEGECSVRRAGARADSAPHTRLHDEGQDKSAPAYDADTVSVLGALDVFGLHSSPSHHHHHHQHDTPNSARLNPGLGSSRGPGGSSSPGFMVVARTQVKAYHITHEDFRALPEPMRMAIESACSFKTAYFMGRLRGLAQLDNARTSLSYGAFTYKLGDLVMSSLGAPQPTKSGGETGKSPPGGQQRGKTPSTRLGGLLDHLAAQQAIQLLQEDARREAAALQGLPPLPLPSSLPPVGSGTLGATAGSGPATAGNSTTATAAAATRDGGLTATRPRSPWDHPPADHTHESHAPGTCGLNSMPPNTKAWPRVVGGRRDPVPTEPPRPQPVPSTLRDRHTAIFQAARHASPRCALTSRISLIQTGQSQSDDDELLHKHAPGPLYTERQPSRRMSDLYRSRAGSSSARHTLVMPDEERTVPPGLGATIRSSSGGRSGAQLPQGSGAGSGVRDVYPLELPGPSYQQYGKSAAGGDGLADPFAFLDGGLESGFGDLPEGLMGGHHSIDRDLLEQQGGAGDGAGSSGGLARSGGLMQTMRKANGLASLLREPPQVNDAPATAAPPVPARSTQTGAQEQEQQQQQQQQQRRRQHLVPPEHDVTDLVASGSGKQAAGSRPGSGAGSGGQAQGVITADATLASPRTGSVQSMVGGLPAPAPAPASAMNLPPSVVLGYESLDPFQWAAIMSYAAPKQRGQQGSQDSILPKPKW
mmetsp:Transcript_13404/g.28665  ORF Transcript_13404/g.28665 Transcript_13404/m.28665 type:complete len:984 (+) Transcript_13404:137-3088(+)|eukprot:CAMPEP_0202896540 /NCGR_PEP_ID=MMETSP1392-20130828/5533_1 /ASSEMBLY_ACC=CAM_ASM_000868 /TAXON_ID=225041 /ORGANISM="Chlamydomonas chlamydogama, Strain SAG 11-48b" /LENGTH=983 /DNA_ID=CAMNT_0049581941 /DNA_START=131 /DNA_END=3082 /DNA_ORIENTATION=-